MSDKNKLVRKISTDTVIPYFPTSDNLIKDLKLDSIYRNSIAAAFMPQYINESGGNPEEWVKTSMFRIGGKFTPKKSQLVKNAEELNSKRDMRKKLIKGTSWPSTKKRMIKKQQGGTLDDEFLNYDNVNISETPLPELTFDTSNFNPYNYISEEPSKREAPNQSTEEISQESNIQKEEKPVPKETVSSIDFDPKLGLMGEFVKLAREEGIPFKITSGYRPGAKTSNGTESWHSKGYALDIIPLDGYSWEDLKNSFKNAIKTRTWMKNNKFGIIDETTNEMLRKTGGTGAHWHIGKDKLAINSFANMFAKNGGILKAQWGSKVTGVYTVEPGDNLTKIAEQLGDGITVDSLLSYNNIPESKKNNIKVGQELLWRKEPGWWDNIKAALRSSEEDKKSENRNTIIESNIVKYNTPKLEKPDPIKIAVDFMTGTEKHNGWEGFFSKPTLEYGSGKGIWTVGYGLTDPKLITKYKNGITKDQAKKEMYKYIKDTVMPDLIKNNWWDNLDSNMQAALIDAHYNLGGTKFNSSKKLFNHLKNNSDIKLVINEMDWNKNTKNGLGDRSGARRALAAGKYDNNYIPYSGKYYQWNYVD